MIKLTNQYRLGSIVMIIDKKLFPINKLTDGGHCNWGIPAMVVVSSPFDESLGWAIKIKAL